MRYTPTIACLWAMASGTTLVISWQEAATNAIQLLTLALTGCGGAMILLYQRKLSADRENRELCRASILAEDLARKVEKDRSDYLSNANAVDEVRHRLDAVIAHRDHMAQRNDQLFEQVAHLALVVERISCRFPNSDGTARCFGEERPPCLG